ncbi:MAG TPA: tetrahydromethanopterin S-methyltransferase subunit F [Methanothermobacter sp.]|uniref:tetrahydromethanopterin S-methyltransferase subunit F n=1 Tax=Methanothermobacter tenebrarum TaxID=680118 RepID=UPI0017BD6E0F|nr:tetrahydromethanopterin S-methyltransferase subunit F [Methanothermobacter tenebrarum]MDD3454996.1 tetrahydromethanopterin S-methyltransferase subunit F [Methanobacteriales archaeon]MDI6882277.1 tetrahydromethanopterin S-methyltransferase subunit F [Methanothermobacter sp.]MDX9694041.1 tetrahydromethanopterin S-methyltransferase subunit F [Methanothermobacter sp.]HHW17093.1 tetrahydromethanopterin S-methyltransferase subunit F [Methanothermobacter sp.]
MIKLSSKPNVRGIKNVTEDIRYRTQLIGRDGRLFAGLIATRISGIGYGLIIAFILGLIIPLLMTYLRVRGVI